MFRHSQVKNTALIWFNLILEPTEWGGQLWQPSGMFLLALLEERLTITSFHSYA